MAKLRKITSDSYTIGALQLNQLIELYQISEEDLTLSLVQTIEAVDLGGDFNNDFNVDFNGAKPTGIFLQTEGIFLLRIPNTGEEYLIYNYSSIEQCIKDNLDLLACDKCKADYFEVFSISMLGHYLIAGLDDLENINLSIYYPNITQDGTLETLFKYAERMNLYCHGCDINTNKRCTCP